MPHTLMIASTNAGKISEFNQLLKPMHCIALPPHTEPVAETGLTFIENALIKARAASIHSTHATLADDSGLVVPALNGQPGIHSARFATLHGQDCDNLTFLLQRLKPIPVSHRQAYFYCALALFTDPRDPTPLLATGALHGVLIDTPRGKHGFGYDPIFYLPELGCTLAELRLAEKNQLSHRAIATRALLTHNMCSLPC